MSSPDQSATDAPLTARSSARLLPWWRHVLASLLLLLGLAQATGGYRLVELGGSPYYLLAGLGVACGAVAIWFTRTLARIIFQLWIAATLLWSLWDTGGEFWGMVSRIGYPIVLWLIALVATSRLRHERTRRKDVASSGSKRGVPN